MVLISDMWNSFIENCKKCYLPKFDLIIDEQLFPCKTNFPIIQYMAKKPNKAGFWLMRRQTTYAMENYI